MFGRSGAAGARMGGRIAAGAARIAGPKVMAAAGAASGVAAGAAGGAAAGATAAVVTGLGIAAAAVAVLGAAAAAVTVLMNKFAEATIQATLRVSKYDARLASAGAMLEVGRTTRDIQLAQSTGKSGSELLRAQDKFEQSYAPLQAKLQNLSNSFAKAWIEFKTMVIDGMVNPVLDGMHDGFEIVNVTLLTLREYLEAIVWIGPKLEAIRKMKEEEWEAHKRAERGKEFMDQQQAARAQLDNMQQMLDAAARRAPF
jgi:hypothetical protein